MTTRKERKGSFYVRQIPLTNEVELTPMGRFNPLRESIVMSLEEYSQYVEWIDNDERDIEEVLTFISPAEQKLIDDNLDTREYIDAEEAYATDSRK